MRRSYGISASCWPLNHKHVHTEIAVFGKIFHTNIFAAFDPGVVLIVSNTSGSIWKFQRTFQSVSEWCAGQVFQLRTIRWRFLWRHYFFPVFLIRVEHSINKLVDWNNRMRFPAFVRNELPVVFLSTCPFYHQFVIMTSNLMDLNSVIDWLGYYCGHGNTRQWVGIYIYKR